MSFSINRAKYFLSKSYHLRFFACGNAFLNALSTALFTIVPALTTMVGKVVRVSVSCATSLAVPITTISKTAINCFFMSLILIK